MILLLIFGPKRLSEVGKGLGQGIRNFKKGLEHEDKDGEKAEADGEEVGTVHGALASGVRAAEEARRALHHL